MAKKKKKALESSLSFFRELDSHGKLKKVYVDVVALIEYFQEIYNGLDQDPDKEQTVNERLLLEFLIDFFARSLHDIRMFGDGTK